MMEPQPGVSSDGLAMNKSGEDFTASYSAEEFVVFKIEREEYALNIKNVREIVKLSDITKIPRSPEYILGITNLRGMVLPVIDSRKRFNLSEIERNENSRMIVIDFKDSLNGLLIDSVSEVLRVDTSKIEKPEKALEKELKSSQIKDYIRGVIKENEGKRIIQLLNLEEILKIEKGETEHKTSLERGTYTTTAEKAERKREEEQFVIFKVTNDEYGFHINAVREILRATILTKVPNTPEYVRGILTLRGKILPIFDFRKMMGNTSRESEYVSTVQKIKDSHILWLTEVKENLYGEKGIEKHLLEKECPINVLVESIDNTNITVKESLEELIDLHNLIHEKIPKLYQLAQKDAEDAKRYFEENIIPEESKLEEIFDRVKNNLVNTGENDRKILVLESGGLSAGILVDRVNEVRNIDKNLIDTSISGTNTTGMELRGIAKIDSGKRLIFLIDEKLLFEERDKNLIKKLKGEEEMSQQREETTGSVSETERFVTFTIDNEDYGINIMEVQEINRVSTITRVPKAPSFIDGVINLRGEVIPVIDIRKRFELTPKAIDERTRVIITDLSGKKTGLIVDRVNEVLGIPKSNIEPTPDIILSNAGSEFLQGVGKVDEGKRMILIINVDKILSAKEKKEFNEMETGGSPIKSKTEKKTPTKEQRDTTTAHSPITEKTTPKRRELKIEE